METIKNDFENSDVTTPWDELTELDPKDLAAERMRERVIELAKMDEGELSKGFPSGNFLYHGAKNERLEAVIKSGYLGNAMAFNDGKVGANSGYEGISWSMDGIDALPGTDGHLAGFLAAPEDVVSSGEKLVVPSRPAPYELLQIGGNMETKKFYEHRIQNEMFCSYGIFEQNSVIDNFVKVKVWLENEMSETPNTFISKSMSPMLFEFADDERCNAEYLRGLYSFNEEEDATELSKELFQQWDIPTGAVWMQRIVDGGAMKDTKYDGMEVSELISEIKNGDMDLCKLIIGTTISVRKHYDSVVDQDLERAAKIMIPIEKMYFVTNRSDLDGWIAKFAESGHEPKGFILYDGDKVTRSNFASAEKGDHAELTSEIIHAVGGSDFWQGTMGINVDEIARGGSRGQVLKETEVVRNKEIKVVDGKLVSVEI